MERFLQQGLDERADYASSLAALNQLFAATA